MCYGIHGECTALSVLFLCSNLTVQQVDVFIFLFIQLCNTSIVILQRHVLTVQMQEGYAESLHKIAMDRESLTGNDPICSVCRYSFCVTASGTVFPCAGWQNNVIGDLNHQTVQEIWETSAKIKELRQVKRSRFLQCVDCKDRGYCTVCMMWNSNENPDGAPFRINQYRCNVAAMTHRKVDKALQRISSAKITSR